jgi:hypothetical protein
MFSERRYHAQLLPPAIGAIVQAEASRGSKKDIRDAQDGVRSRPLPSMLPTCKGIPIMSKIIVLSGHGAWDLRDGYTKLPARCAIRFYTLNMKTLSDALGGDIDRGIVSGLEPDQVGAPFATIPNMRLYPPHGLNIRVPDLRTWNVIKLPQACPADSKNLQVRISDRYPAGYSLEEILDMIEAALIGQDVTILWAACRAIGLKKSAFGKSIGVNKMQR